MLQTDDAYNFDGLKLPTDFVPEWLTIFGYSALLIGTVGGFIILGLFYLVQILGQRGFPNYDKWIDDQYEKNHKYVVYNVTVIVLGFIVAFIVLIVSMSISAGGQKQYPELTKTWLSEKYGIEILDKPTLETLLNGVDLNDKEKQASKKVFVKQYGVLELIPGDGGQFYLLINDKPAEPKT